MPLASSRFIAFAALVAALAATACSLLLSEDPMQCHTTADCVARGPAFARSFCDTHHGCETTCVTNKECAGDDADPAVCRADHTCAKLLSDDCKTLVADPADLDDDQVIWFGMLVPLDAATEPFSRAKEHAAELMRRDFMQATGGLPPAREGGPNRRFAFVVCDHSVDADRAARHLADEVRVPAIIGPIYSGVLIQVATDVTIPRGVLLISPAATSPFITNLANKNGLIWRTAPSDTVQSVAVAHLIEEKIEPELRAHVLGKDEAIRVAVVHKGDAYGVGLQEVLFDKLVFNGKSAGDNGERYLAIDYGDPSNPANASSDATYARAVDTLVAFAPHIVIVAGTTEGITKVFAPLEAKWPATAPFRPRYVMTDGAHPRTELLAAVGANADLRKRVLGTVPGTSSPLYRKFLERYASVFQDGTVPIQTTAATYDAIYMLAYSTAFLGPREVTGASLGEGLKKLVPPGTRVDVSPERIEDALARLAAGDNIDLNGTSGPLDFDVTTGDAEADIQVWCLDVDANGNATRFEDSGLFYNATTKALDGQMSCP